MKKIFFILFLIVLLHPFPALAALSPTPSPSTPSESVTEKLSTQINDLKDKIASRVAQLKLVEKKGFVGTAKDIGATSLTIIDISGIERAIDVDEITKFTASGKDSFGISDIKKGTKISVVGLYNKESERLLARFISTYTVPVYITGVVTTIDKDNYTVTVTREEGKTYTIDIESVTKTLEYDKENNSSKLGFSKITIGMRVFVVGYADKKEANRMVATRLLVFPLLPKNPKIVVVPNAVNPSGAVTSTGSGKKLTPIK